MIAFAENHSRPYVLVLLAGALRPSSLRSQLDEPVLSLPLSIDQSLLDAWIDMSLRTSARCDGIKIVVSSARDAEIMRKAVRTVRRTDGDAAGIDWQSAGGGRDVEVIVDPSEWRGPAGLLYDIAMAPRWRIADDTIVVAAEAAVLPPQSLDPLLSHHAEPGLAGAIGADEDDRPAGVYAFDMETIRAIPAIGFHDIKEQLLPALYSDGKRVPVVRIVREVVRLRDLESYLYAVHTMLSHEPNAIGVAPGAVVSNAAILSGSCILQRGARIEDGALIHDSVIMDGAQIGGGAVVARSIVGPGSLVHARSVVRSAVIASPEIPRPLPLQRRERQGARRIFRRPLSFRSAVRHEGDA